MKVVDMTSHFQDGVHDVISRRKVLPPGECTRSICPPCPAHAAVRTCTY